MRIIVIFTDGDRAEFDVKQVTIEDDMVQLEHTSYGILIKEPECPGH